jgi:membrane-associated phospholipid phosphatase
MLKKINFSFLICILFSFAQAQNAEERFLINTNVHRNKSFDPFFKTITNTSIYVSILLPTTELTVGYATKNKKLVLNGLKHTLATTSMFLINSAAKRIIKRERPYTKLTQLQPYYLPTDYSFPSGHTSNAFVTAGNFAFTYKKWYIVLPAYAWATSVGYSRMHLGVHYPSDVLVGALAGTLSAYLINRWQKHFFTPKVQGILQVPK